MPRNSARPVPHVDLGDREQHLLRLGLATASPFFQVAVVAAGKRHLSAFTVGRTFGGSAGCCCAPQRRPHSCDHRRGQNQHPPGSPMPQRSARQKMSIITYIIQGPMKRLVVFLAFVAGSVTLSMPGGNRSSHG